MDQQCIIKQNKTNKKLNNNQLMYWEFLWWYWLWLLMATHNGCHHRNFGLTTSVLMYHGARCWFHENMIRSRFEDILQAIRYTTQQPTNDDGFYKVREMVDFWNENMGKVFRPGYQIGTKNTTTKVGRRLVYCCV
jgi:hypothetical protein